jgi:YesN/AraC family two-component response regulator
MSDSLNLSGNQLAHQSVNESVAMKRAIKSSVFWEERNIVRWKFTEESKTTTSIVEHQAKQQTNKKSAAYFLLISLGLFSDPENSDIILRNVVELLSHHTTSLLFIVTVIRTSHPIRCHLISITHFFDITWNQIISSFLCLHKLAINLFLLQRKDRQP